MSWPRGAARLWLQGALVAALPAVAALVVAAVLGSLPATVAVAAGLTALAVAAVVARPVAAAIAAVSRQAEAVERSGAGEPPPLEAGPGTGRLVAGAARLERGWRQRVRDLERALAAEEALVESLPTPLLVLDRDGVVTRANRAARDLLGRDAVSRNLAVLLRHPELLAAVDEVGGGGPPREVEFTRPPPQERDLAARIWRLAAGPGGRGAVAAALSDLTALKRLERMRADFIANASHELRTPLTSLAGFIDTLRHSARDDAEARDRFLAIMAEQTERMTRLVGDLLSLSEIETGEDSPPAHRVDLGVVLDGVRRSLEIAARARKIRIELDLSPGFPEVTGDPDQLFQLFQNLIDNAIKYGDSDGEVRVEGRRGGGDQVTVVVRDRGEGIPPQHLDRLTERFYRADTARSRQLGGTGLGLAIVKHILRRHRGRLDIDSVLGEGSSFTVTLPAAPKGPGHG